MPPGGRRMALRGPSRWRSDSGCGDVLADSSSTRWRVCESSCIATTSERSEKAVLYATIAWRAIARTSAEASPTMCTSVSSSITVSGVSTCFGHDVASTLSIPWKWQWVKSGSSVSLPALARTLLPFDTRSISVGSSISRSGRSKAAWSPTAYESSTTAAHALRASCERRSGICSTSPATMCLKSVPSASIPPLRVITSSRCSAMSLRTQSERRDCSSSASSVRESRLTCLRAASASAA
eukprot:scaffold87251_cov31-Tisochrysis_lutea.AAC.1